MSTRDRPTFREMLRADPVRSGLFVATPVAVAAVQLLNSVVNGLSFLVSVPLAVVMVAFSGFLLTYQFAQYRVERLEAETFSASSN